MVLNFCYCYCIVIPSEMTCNLFWNDFVTYVILFVKDMRFRLEGAKTK